ncbi:MAG: glycosyltransferase family 4 protein [Actinomycetota bacterium]|nr:glycosyltransferase family 4 protein [Actinomycetota bacterium]
MTSVLVANPSADVYGSDLQLLDSISAMIEREMSVTVCLPEDGPLIPLLRYRGAKVIFHTAPVARRSALSLTGIFPFIGQNLLGVFKLARLLHTVSPDVVYVNTITIPVWIAAARLAKVPVLCHLHEAEDGDSKWVLRGLMAPLLLATALVANGNAARTVVASVYPRLVRKMSIVHNGIPNPPDDPRANPYVAGSELRLAILGRLSPRKLVEVAIEATAILRKEGRFVTLAICGTPFAGYEWYEQQLQARIRDPDVSGAIKLRGYVFPIWSLLDEVHALVAPSSRESFGNVIVEAQLARRPVVAAKNLGYVDIIDDGESGLLVPPNDAPAMAAAIAKIMDDSALFQHLADTGRASAIERFSVQRYRTEIADAVAALHR